MKSITSRLSIRSDSSSSLNLASSTPSLSVFSSPGSPAGTAGTSTIDDDDVVRIKNLFIRKDAGLEAHLRGIYDSRLAPLIDQELIHSAYTEEYNIELCCVGFRKSTLSPAILISTRTLRAKRKIFTHLEKLQDLKAALQEHNLDLHVVVDNFGHASGSAKDLSDLEDSKAYLTTSPGSGSLCGSKIVFPSADRQESLTCTVGLPLQVGDKFLAGRSSLHALKKAKASLTDAAEVSTITGEEEDEEENDDDLALSLFPDDTTYSSDSDDDSSDSSDSNLDFLELPRRSDSFLERQHTFLDYVASQKPEMATSPRSQIQSGYVKPLHSGEQADWFMFDAKLAAPDMHISDLARSEVNGYQITKFHCENPDAKVPVTIATHEGEVHGFIQPGKVIFRSGSSAYELRLVTLEYSLRPGCSGSSVTYQDELCGTIQVIRENVPWAYMIPIATELKEMEAVCGTPVHLFHDIQASMINKPMVQKVDATQVPPQNQTVDLLALETKSSPKDLSKVIMLATFSTQRQLEDPLVLTTSDFALDSAPPYCALSYCWGTGPRSTARVNGETVSISSGLNSALRALFKDGYRGRYFWVDALCIDQISNERKIQQVTLMSQIYQRAVEVLPFPSTYKNSLHGYADYVETPEEPFQDVKFPLGWTEYPGPWWSASGTNKLPVEEYYAGTSLTSNKMRAFSGTPALAQRTFLCGPRLSRRWTFQVLTPTNKVIALVSRGINFGKRPRIRSSSSITKPSTKYLCEDRAIRAGRREAAPQTWNCCYCDSSVSHRRGALLTTGMEFLDKYDGDPNSLNHSQCSVCISLTTNSRDKLGADLDNGFITSSDQKPRLTYQNLAMLNETQRFVKEPTCNSTEVIDGAGQRWSCLFRRNAFEKLGEDVDNCSSNSLITLPLLQGKEYQSTQRELKRMKHTVKSEKANSMAAGVRQRVKAPDLTVNYDNICNERPTDTTLCAAYKSDRDNLFSPGRVFSVILLGGRAGCGKSTLCSMAIENTFRHQRAFAPKISIRLDTQKDISSTQWEPMKNDSVDQGMHNFGSYQVAYDRRFQLYSDDDRQRIKDCLSQHASDLFQWVIFQPHPLKLCPRSAKYLKHYFQTIPHLFIKVYKHNLHSGSEESQDNTQRILSPSYYVPRLQLFNEVVKIITVDFDDLERYNHNRELATAGDLLHIWRVLIEISEKSQPVRVGHSLVQEYLMSDRFRQSLASNFALLGPTPSTRIRKDFSVHLFPEEFMKYTQIQEVYEQQSAFWLLILTEMHFGALYLLDLGVLHELFMAVW